MGLLDGGLQAIFGAAFAPLFLDGVLHVIAKDVSGAIIKPVTFTDVPVKLMPDSLEALLKQGWQIPDRAIALIVLQAGIAAAPTLDDQITDGAGARWRVSKIGQDPSRGAWIILGTPV